MSLIPFNKELITRIELAPNAYNLSGRGDKTKDLVLLGAYGALLKPTSFIQRLASSFKEANIDLPNAELFGSHFVGWYKYPFMKLTFQKKAWDSENRRFIENEGKATLAFGNIQDYIYIGVIAIPKVALRQGSELMISEGCNDERVQAEGCHYTLLTNHLPLEPVQNDVRETPSIFPQLGEVDDIPNIIPPSGIMYFNSTIWALEQEKQLIPSFEYKKTIEAAHKKAVKDGFQLPKSYVDAISAIECMPENNP